MTDERRTAGPAEDPAAHSPSLPEDKTESNGTPGGYAAGVEQALDAARHLAEHGVPVFVGKPALDENGEWIPDGGHQGTGYWFPSQWERTVANPATVDQWQPGDALCAVMGHTVDGADFDTQKDSDVIGTVSMLGLLPRAYGVASTPSGGEHRLVASLGVRSHDGVLPAFDLKAGVGGRGHGFLFIAPTIKLSKVTGEPAAYRWIEPPVLDELVLVGGDDSGTALRAYETRGKVVDEHDGPSYDGPAFAQLAPAEQAWSARHVVEQEAKWRGRFAEALNWPETRKDEKDRGWELLARDWAYACARMAVTPWIALDTHTAHAMHNRVLPEAIATDERCASKWYPGLLAKAAQKPIEPPPWDGLNELPTAVVEFFDRTPVLQHIRQAAHSRVLSAPMLLMQVLARVLLEVPPGWMLPAVVGSEASLNLGFAVVGLSSAGKSSSSDVAGELLSVDQDSMIKGIGSGEGMIDAFHDVVKVEGRNMTFLKDKPHVLLTVDEVETLEKLLGRSGSTMGPILRTALTGGLLGNANAKAGGRSRHVPKRVYRLVVTVAVQPALSGVLLNGEDSGLPQRFLWVGGKDPSLPPITELPDWPGDLSWGVWWELQDRPKHRIIDYPEHVQDAIRQAQYDSQTREDADPAKGHLMLARLKIAAALAFLHEEHDISDQWWELAGVLTDASVEVQQYCRGVLAAEAAKLSDIRALAAGRSRVVETDAMEAEQAQRAAMAENIVMKLEAAGPDGMAQSDLRNSFRHGRSRDRFDQVLPKVVGSGRVRAQEIEYNGKSGHRLFAV